MVDSSAVDKKGNFTFTNAAVIEDNTFYRLNVVDTRKVNPGAIMMVGTHENFAFFLLNRHSQIVLSTSAEQVGAKLVLSKADKANHLINRLNKIRSPYDELVDRLVKRRNALDQALPAYKDSLAAIRALMDKGAISTKYYQGIRKFADTVSNPYVSLLAMQYLPDDDYHSFHLEMNERYLKMIPGSEYTAQFNAGLTGESTYLKTGSKAPDFMITDSKGRTVTMADLKGKYVLIDFWASWCTPCRVENVMYIKPVYQQYRDKGFTVLSVSQDISRENWLNAIEKDDIDTWRQVSDLKGVASKTISDYKVISLPYNYLIDPNGVIIAQNLRGAELEEFLKKTL